MSSKEKPKTCLHTSNTCRSTALSRPRQGTPDAGGKADVGAGDFKFVVEAA
jgi:hypothetical protein